VLPPPPGKRAQRGPIIGQQYYSGVVRVKGPRRSGTPSLRPPPAPIRVSGAPSSGRQWQAVLPESVKALPASGTNCQEYEPVDSVSLRTPNVSLLRTWLFERTVANA